MPKHKGGVLFRRIFIMEKSIDREHDSS